MSAGLMGIFQHSCTQYLQGSSYQLKCWPHVQTRKTQAQKDLEEQMAKQGAKCLKRKVQPNMLEHHDSLQVCLLCPASCLMR